MIDALPLLLGPEGYQISRSVRLRSSASAYFNRTPGSASNRTTWTWSGWVKRGTLGSINTLFAAGSSGSALFVLRFDADNTIFVYQDNAGTDYGGNTTAVYRDVSAWYHLVLAIDTTQATEANRLKLYVNNAQVTVSTAFGAFAQNADTYVNNTNAHYVGSYGASNYFDGYLTEINFIDGQALTPASFGETDAVTGVWKPKKYTGTYGTNGFYLNFSDNSAATAAAIGKDYSANGNNWTPNNISVTAGVTYDSMLDVPTQWADGGNGRGNYCTGNPLIMYNGGGGAAIIPKNGNLDLIGGAGWAMVGSTIAVSTGKWYWEATFFKPGSGDGVLGIHKSNTSLFQIVGYSGDPNGYGYAANGNKLNNSTGVAYGASYTNGDVIGVALDLDAGTLTFYKNNTSQGVAFSSLSGEFFPAFSSETAYFQANFGQRPFSYTPPTGFKALNTLNLPTPTILKGNQYFNIGLYTGNGSTQSLTQLGFQPDFVWNKSRANTEFHVLMDSVRTPDKALYSNSTQAEDSGLGNTFTSTGMNVVSTGNINTNGISYVYWGWKEGATQGFDIVTYTGNGAASQVVNHSLGVAPNFVIVKNRSASASWNVWGSQGFTRLGLNITNGDLGNFPITRGSSSITLPSTSDVGWNSNGNNYVAYLFAAVSGYSAFGSYTGNGSADGPFCFTGFLPRWIMIKRTDTTSNWIIIDTERSPYNQTNQVLLPNSSAAEGTGAGYGAYDFLSNGFKPRNVVANETNVNGGTYVYACFASNPFKHSLAR